MPTKSIGDTKMNKNLHLGDFSELQKRVHPPFQILKKSLASSVFFCKKALTLSFLRKKSHHAIKKRASMDAKLIFLHGVMHKSLQNVMH